jgi:hypothetical protein
VFLSQEAPKGELLLRAMDHTHCFDSRPELTKRIAHINRIQDPNVYGLFPEFREFLDKEVVGRCADRLRQASRAMLLQITQTMPAEWDVDRSAREALVSLLLGRARYVADCIIERLWPQKELPFTQHSEDKP